jgi:Ca2+-binding EF-hand superfamily protein
MKMRFGILIAGLLVSGVAVAKGTDTNKDGNFSREELLAASHEKAEKKFKKADTNSDGRVTMDEIKGKKLTVAKGADQNKDGMITWDEYKAYSTNNVDKRLAKKDTNGDGMLSKEERSHKKKS